jgi:hypothetical protein
MAQSATLAVENQTPEKEAWELFEVGSYDEVISIANENPNSHFLFHLSQISRFENGESIKNYSPKGMSLLSPLVEAYVNFHSRKFEEAGNQLEIYFKNKNSLFSYPFTKLSLDVYFKLKKYDYALAIIRGYKKKFMDLAFVKEEAIALYHLKNYTEVVNLYRNHTNEMNDPEVHRVIGMALLFLGKHQDAESILDMVPGKLKLPSFEEKRKQYEKIIINLEKIEAKRKELAPRQLEDLGFAYLFNGDYSKAESVFTDLTRQLK